MKMKNFVSAIIVGLLPSLATAGGHSGFGGHGMNTAPISAICLSDFLLGNKDSLNSFNGVRHLPHYDSFGKVAAEIVYKDLSLKDFISEYRPI